MNEPFTSGAWTLDTFDEELCRSLQSFAKGPVNQKRRTMETKKWRRGRKKKRQFRVPEANGRRCCLWDSWRKKGRYVPVAAQRGFVGASAGPARPIPLFPIMAASSPRGLPPTFLNLKSLRGGDRLGGRWNTRVLYKSSSYRLTRELSFSLSVLSFFTFFPSIPLSLSFIAPSLLCPGTSIDFSLSPSL